MKIQASFFPGAVVSALLLATLKIHALNAKPDLGNCGALALVEVARTLQPTNEHMTEILRIAPSGSGFSMSDLERFSDQYGLELVPVQRVKREGLIVPSLAHWRVGHYVAITGQRAGDYQVFDPAFGKTQWMSGTEINARASGFFLIPRQRISADWRQLTGQETDHGFGRG